MLKLIQDHDGKIKAKLTMYLLKATIYATLWCKNGSKRETVMLRKHDRF